MLNGRSKRWSILPALGINGYLYYEIYQGSFNSERFNSFVRRLLTKMNPFPGPRSVLILDNAKVHHTLVSSLSLHLTLERQLTVIGTPRHVP